MKNYRAVAIPNEIRDRVFAAAELMSIEYGSSPNAIAAGRMIGILLDHFVESPPDSDWFKRKFREIPRRGRPPINPRTLEEAIEAGMVIE